MGSFWRLHFCCCCFVAVLFLLMMLIMLMTLMTMKKKAGWWFQYDQHPVWKDANGQISSLNPQFKQHIIFSEKLKSHRFTSHIGYSFHHYSPRAQKKHIAASMPCSLLPGLLIFFLGFGLAPMYLGRCGFCGHW